MANQFEYDYSNLPLEIVVKILSNLTWCDIESITLTCKQWLYASQFPEIQSKINLKLSGKFSNTQCMFKFRYFSNIHLYNIKDTSKFKFTLPGEHVSSITFEKCSNLTLENFLIVIKDLKNLKELTFINCQIINEYEILKQSDLEIFEESISNLKSITFQCSENYQIDELCSTIALFKNLKNLESFNIIDALLHNKKYIKDFQYCLYNIIKKNSKTLKQLRLPYLFNNSKFLQCLKLMNGLNLKTLEIQSIEIRSINLNDFILFQNELLNVNFSNSLITNDDIKVLVTHLKLLESLKLHNCKSLTNKSLIEIANLKNLKSLTISGNDKFTSVGLRNGILKDFNLQLVELNTMGISFNEKTYIEMGNYLNNIKILHIGSKSLNDNGIQSIIKNCTELVDLNLYESSQITDYGLTGFDLFGPVPIRTGFSICNLKKLINLNLRRCCKITDRVLISSLKFTNLKTLHLPSCFPFVIDLPWLKIRKISIDSLRVFVKNCPNINELNLMGCSGYENLAKGIKIVATKLKYLRILRIARRCEMQETDQLAILRRNRRDLSYIGIKCKCLTCVDIRKTCEEFFDEKFRWIENDESYNLYPLEYM